MSLEVKREEVIQQLCRAFTNDQITLQELDAGLEAAHRARSPEELRALVGSPPAPLESNTLRVATSHSVRARASDEPLRIAATFASVRKQGDWEPPLVTHASATFGEVVLDFREARIPAGVTTVHVSATMGSVEIIVPPGLHIQCDGSATFGEFTEQVSMSAAPEDEAPTVRITGEALFAEVKVVMRLPGETAREAKRREKRR